MHHGRFLMVLAGGAALFAGTTAIAALLGVLPGFPAVSFNSTGTTQYTSASQHLSISASPLAIRFAPDQPPRLIQPVTGLQVLTVDIFIDSGGMLYGGHPDEDLLIIGQVDANGDGNIDYSGVLLTGEIAAFGWENTGGTTDFFDFRFTLTGGALASLFNDHDIGVLLTIENSTFDGTFTSDFGGGAKGVLGPIPLLDGFGGCTPGYWKQPHHYSSWPAPYTPDTLFASVFGRPIPGDPTLVEALRLKGGHLNALMRHAAAALLNAAHPDVNPDGAIDTPAEVINAFQNAFDSGSYNATKDMFEASNENGCPL
jgi:hypothetical protein